MLTLDDILRILPHRPPLLMVDRVTALSAGRIVAHRIVRADEPWLAGHFPSNPVVPGVLLVEAMAQAGALLAHHRGDFDPERQILYFMTIERARFRAPVRPGDSLDIEVVPLRPGPTRWKMRGAVRVGEREAASADFCAVIAERP